MSDHKTGTHEEWLAARLELLKEEKALTRPSDEVARMRQELPWASSFGGDFNYDFHVSHTEGEWR
jgi:predicted dithiol-disulfide oxidoreductase (DUF899 family)